ncbi:hypothetical protein [Hymenobacter psychrophilus]|nr:hypothetical protein [Hymenobacter psychrophilus]
MPTFAGVAFWLLLIVGGLLTSCSYGPLLPTSEAELVGNWEWTQTITANHSTLTPTNTGHRMSIRFDRRGRARFYQDDVLVSAANFKVTRNGLRLLGTERYTITYHGYQRRQIYSLTGSQLQLQDVTSQPANHRFRRTNAPIITSSVHLMQ